MEKYYLMAIEGGCMEAMGKLRRYYKRNQDYNNLIDLYYNRDMNDKLIKILNQVLTKNDANINCKKIIDILSNIDINDDAPIYLKLLKNSLTDNLASYDLHFQYTVNGNGYNEAKSDFMERVATI